MKAYIKNRIAYFKKWWLDILWVLLIIVLFDASNESDSWRFRVLHALGALVLWVYFFRHLDIVNKLEKTGTTPGNPDDKDRSR